MRGMPSVLAAEELARELLEPLEPRWAHTRAVVARADELAPAVTPVADRRLLVVAAWWHDLGYAPGLRDTGCHQIYGARYLAARGYPERLCALLTQADLDRWFVTHRLHQRDCVRGFLLWATRLTQATTSVGQARA
jgi:hypothetical protein